MKLTMMAGYFYPEQSADTHLNYDMALELSKRGFDVTVVVPFPSRGLTSEEQKKYLDKTDERVSEHLRILRVGKPTAYTDSFARKAWNLFSESRNLYRAAKKIPTDVYLVVSTPPFLGYAVPKLARRAKVVYKLQDVFPDSLIHSKGLTESHPLIQDSAEEGEKRIPLCGSDSCLFGRCEKNTALPRCSRRENPGGVRLD